MSLIVRRRRKREINIVPLIDVLTILIFFFQISMQFKQQKALNLTLPKIETAGRNQFNGPMVIAIDKDGYTYLNGKLADKAQLTELVNKVKVIDQDVTVLIKANETTPLNKVTSVMDICRKAGLNKIRLESR